MCVYKYMKKIHILLIAGFIVSLTHAIPSLINYQGRLVDPNGELLTGNKSMSVSIYDAVTNGLSLYTEDVGEVTLDSNGIYSFSFGTNETDLASALQTIGEHWLELTVDGSAQTPRERVLSVPFAQVAGGIKSTFKQYTNAVHRMHYSDGLLPSASWAKYRSMPLVAPNTTSATWAKQIFLKPGSRLKAIAATVSSMDDNPNDGGVTASVLIRFYSQGFQSSEEIAFIDFENDGSSEKIIDDVIIKPDRNYYITARLNQPDLDTPEVDAISYIYEYAE